MIEIMSHTYRMGQVLAFYSGGSLIPLVLKKVVASRLLLIRLLIVILGTSILTVK